MKPGVVVTFGSKWSLPDDEAWDAGSGGKVVPPRRSFMRAEVMPSGLVRCTTEDGKVYEYPMHAILMIERDA